MAPLPTHERLLVGRVSGGGDDPENKVKFWSMQCVRIGGIANSEQDNCMNEEIKKAVCHPLEQNCPPMCSRLHSPGWLRYSNSLRSRLGSTSGNSF